MMTWRISAARRSSSAGVSDLRSAGEWMRSSKLISLGDPGPEQAARHSEQGAHEHFEGRVAEQLHQALGAGLRHLEMLVDQAVQHHRLPPRRAAQPRGIIHDDQAEK